MVQVNRIYLIFNPVHFLVDSSDSMYINELTSIFKQEVFSIICTDFAWMKVCNNLVNAINLHSSNILCSSDFEERCDVNLSFGRIERIYRQVCLKIIGFLFVGFEKEA